MYKNIQSYNIGHMDHLARNVRMVYYFSTNEKVRPGEDAKTGVFSSGS